MVGKLNKNELKTKIETTPRKGVVHLSREEWIFLTKKVKE